MIKKESSYKFVKGKYLNYKQTMNVLLITLISCIAHASQVPTIDFNNTTKEELNRLAIEKSDLQLTPRSQQSLLDKVNQLEITAESDNYINGFLDTNNIRLSTMDNVFMWKLAKEYYQKYGKKLPENPVIPSYH